MKFLKIFFGKLKHFSIPIEFSKNFKGHVPLHPAPSDATSNVTCVLEHLNYIPATQI